MDNLAPDKLELKTTRDAFLNGQVEVMQFAKNGHRAGLDAILLAAGLPTDISGNLADLGAGSGVAGIAAIALRPKLSVTLVECNSRMAELAFQTTNLARNSKLNARTKVLKADVTLSGQQREKAGLLPCSFEYVIMNPPYNHSSSNQSSVDLIKAEAHMMAEGGLDAWMRTTTTILKPRGLLVMIYRAQSIGQIIAAAQGRLGGLTIMPIYSRVNEPAKRLLIRATKGSRAPVSFAPPLVIHNEDEGFTKKVDDVLNGVDVLF